MNALEESKGRIVWIDFFKGFGALLVVFGHSNLPENLAWWIWSFHMPMFFFISGYLFNGDKTIDLNRVLKRRVETLLIPYLFFSILFIIILPVLNNTSKIPHEIGSYREVIKIVHDGWKGLALWFIPVLFFTEIIFAVLIKYLGTRHILVFLIISLLCLLGYYFSIGRIHFPYKAEVIPTAIVFYALGFYGKHHVRSFLKYAMQSDRQFITLLALLSVNILFCYLNSGRLDMCFNRMNNIIFTYLSAVSGIFFSIILSYYLTFYLKDTNYIKVIVTYLGRNTMIILGIHQLIKICLSSLSLLFNQTIFLLLMKHIIFWLLLHGIILAINKHFYFVLGKKRSV
ncbi:acyltransferase family protein [Dyadobacter flavalbus]|uniref:Acyltransferase family protein n=1 Tax=Dyadobacter flavalbus TaxID=2579942 RepID=A0A5M8QL23_9BACT|nr:acyltransferase family protein [Dyadobacter flavalbus]KAA6436759.1 acyltransferase family protein [Dyadobacter flavalbus]